MSDLDSGKIQPSGRQLNVVVIGGGMCGLLTSMLLADDGHRVTVLERDKAEPPTPTDAWHEWDRGSIRQFHMGHFFLPRFRTELLANLPRVVTAIEDVGGLSVNPIKDIPEAMTGGWRDDDDRFEAITGRRPVVEATVARCAAETDGVTIERGVTVAKLLTAPSPHPDKPIRVTGVETDDGRRLNGDLVVDATGRNSALPRLLAAVGAPPPTEESDDSGFVYYGRAYRSADGSLPASIGGGLQAYDSISTLTLAADNGTWQIAFVASGQDRAMRKVRDEDRFNEVWRSYPLVAHWVDGEPLCDIEMMANLQDRIRHFVVDGAPVATGIAAIGDSWACTNPSVGRGVSMALLHALELRDHLRVEPLDDPVAWSLGWHKRTAATVERYYRETVRSDRHRLGQIEAEIQGGTYSSDDPSFAFMQALPAAIDQDPEILRAYLDTFMMHRLVDDVMADADLVERTLKFGADAQKAPGPSRPELERLLA